VGSNPTLRTIPRTYRSKFLSESKSGILTHEPPRERHLNDGVYAERIVQILDHSFWMKKQGYRDATVTSSVASLKALAKDTDLFDVEGIKENIAFRDVSESTKEKLVQVYDRFLRQHEIKWTKPRYKRVGRLPHIPFEADIDHLIAALSKRQGTFIQFLKETGARAGEAWNLKWIDMKPNNVVLINQPEKGSNPRAIRVSSRLIALLNDQPKWCQYVFKYRDSSDFKSFQRFFYHRRKKLAEKLQNPKFLSINMKSLRHWKATQEYAKTKDLLFVQRLLGHKNINNTMVYVHLTDFRSEEDYIVKVASSIEEFTGLLEQGFEFVSDYEGGLKILRKRK